MPNPNLELDSKIGLRAQLRARRNALSATQQRRAAAELLKRAQQLPIFARSTRIAIYIANDGEIDPAPLLNWCLAQQKRCYLPVLPTEGRVLGFAEVTAKTQFRPNRFGIAEPLVAEQAAEQVAGSAFLEAKLLDLVLLPLVGFDRRGNRIGMGGGFYDQTFGFKSTHPTQPPRLVGLAHEIQAVARIDCHNWDIPLSAVITERRVYDCEGAAIAQV